MKRTIEFIKDVLDISVLAVLLLILYKVMIILSWSGVAK
jgi:hypothetical protein